MNEAKRTRKCGRYDPLALPVSPSGSEEGKLLIAEAKELIKEGRAEHKNRITKHTGERLAKERPRLYRLIAAMLSEEVSLRQIRRTTLCDAYTIRSVERREAESIQTLKTAVTKRTARVCKMSIERMEQELPKMPINQVPVVFGITADKLMSFTGDPNCRIEHIIKRSEGSIFDRIANLQADMEKVIQARVIEPTGPSLKIAYPGQTNSPQKEAP